MPFANYVDFQDCVNKNQDKSDPKAYCAVIQKQAEGENMKKDWRIIEYNVPIELSEATKLEADDFVIQGTAINETITRNNVKYTAEELANSAHTLNNKPILKDHRNEVDAIVGRTTNSGYDSNKKSVLFEGKIMDKQMREMIKDGRITNVSIGAKVKDLVKEEKDGSEYVVAKGLEFLELSLVPVPGDANATIAQALSEAYNIKNEAEHDFKCPECEKEFESKKDLKKHMMDEHMEEKTKEENKMEGISKEQFDALKAELDAIKAEKIKAEELKVKEAEMAKLKEELKAELFKQLEENKPKTKGLVSTEKSVEEGLVLEELGNGKYAIWNMPKVKGV